MSRQVICDSCAATRPPAPDDWAGWWTLERPNFLQLGVDPGPYDLCSLTCVADWVEKARATLR